MKYVKYITRASLAAAAVVASWTYAISQVHLNWSLLHIGSTLSLGDQLLIGSLCGGVGCLVLMLMLPTARWRRLNPATWAFVFTVGGWLTLSQLETQERGIPFGSLRSYYTHHVPIGWP